MAKNSLDQDSHKEMVSKPNNVILENFEGRKSLNNRFLRERGMASNPKMEYQVFLCISQRNSAMATLGLKEMGKIPLGRQGKKFAKLAVSV